jgi:5-methylcytosine-specific restriction endonuclease McrA
MDAETRASVWHRAGNCCEYRRRPQFDAGLVEFHIEHIYAKQHGGSDDLQNLCLSCPECNWSKGTNLSGLLDGKIVPLFHPRRQTWARHFQWDGPVLIGRRSAERLPSMCLTSTTHGEFGCAKS